MQAVIANDPRPRVVLIILGAVLMVGGLFVYRAVRACRREGAAWRAVPPPGVAEAH